MSRFSAQELEQRRQSDEYPFDAWPNAEEFHFICRSLDAGRVARYARRIYERIEPHPIYSTWRGCWGEALGAMAVADEEITERMQEYARLNLAAYVEVLTRAEKAEAEVARLIDAQ